MAVILPDGTVIPSWMSMEAADPHPTSDKPGESQYALKVGTVVKVYYPDDTANIRKDRIEYDVKVSERNGRKGFNVSVYRNCVCADLFGGVADSVEYTLRPSDQDNNPDATYQTGSAVLILCLHGDSNGGVIVGGIRNLRRQKLSNKDRGHFLEFEFNGINVEVNKDGELILTYKSKTDIEGTPQDLTAGGSFVKIDKTGSIEINDNVAGRIRIDKPSSDIFIETTKANVRINAKKAIRSLADASHISNAPLMKVGGDKSDEPLVLGNTFMKFYNAMVDIFNGHTHREHDWSPNPMDPAFAYVTKKPTTALKSISTAKMSKTQLSDFVFTKKKYVRDKQ